MERALVFMDESGNTGSKYSDLAQPVFTFGAIAVDEEMLNDAENRFVSIKKNHNYSVESIIHATRLSDRNREKLTRAVLSIIFEQGLWPFAVISEKRFVIAAFIEDDFFDPVYNSSCDNSWTHPEGKRERANIIYECLTNETYKACCETFNTGEKIRYAYESISHDLEINSIKNQQCHFLSEKLKGAEDQLNQLAEIISTLNSNKAKLDRPAGVVKSPNFFSFLGMLQMLENHYIGTGDRMVDIIFESSRQFDQSFEEFFGRLKNARKSVLYFKNKLPMHFGFEALENFITASPKNCILLQAVDLVTTSINKLMIKILNGQTILNDFEIYLLFTILHISDQFERRFFDFVASDKFQLTLTSILLNSIEKRNG
jgi:hypothetical protein